jgi:hypothetical protein
MAHDVAILNLRGVSLLPDNDQWHNRFQIKSESSARLYTVAQNKSNGQFACSCMGWIRYRHCKHLDVLHPVLSRVSRGQVR